MAASAELLAFLIEQMSGFAPVTQRRMFGGAGLYRDGRIFALVASDTLFLKSDSVSAPLFDAEGLKPFSYMTKDGENTITSYRRAPESCLDDPDEMTRWCNIAWAAALRADARKEKATKKLSKRS